MKTGDKIANWIIAIVFAALIGVGWYLASNHAESKPCVEQSDAGPY